MNILEWNVGHVLSTILLRIIFISELNEEYVISRDRRLYLKKLCSIFQDQGSAPVYKSHQDTQTLKYNSTKQIFECERVNSPEWHIF